MKRPLAFLGGLVALAACHKTRTSIVASSDPTSTALPHPPVVDAASPSPPLASDECRDYERRLDATLHGAIDAIGDAGFSYGPGHWSPNALRTAKDEAGLQCFGFPHGAWWIDLGSDLNLQLDAEISTHTVVRAALDGHAVPPWSPDGNGIYVGYGGMPTTMSNELLTDYDGDGIPELWVRTDEDGVEGGHFSSSWVLTIHDRKIGEYAPAHGLGAVRAPVDVDGDGRLDLPVNLDLGMIQGGCMGKPTWTPADLLAHALPNGGFSTTDAVALGRAKKWCPSMPTQFKTQEDALCARLWTAPADLAAVRARIAASCVPWDCALEAAGKPQKHGAAQVCNDMLETFDQKTSFSLRPP